MKVRSNRPRYTKRPGLSFASVVLLLVLLAAPVAALTRIATTIDWRLLAILPLGLSTLAFVAYWSDKRRAEAGEWRVPESTLQVLGLLGGWPGAFVAQRTFRHKTAKTSFQGVFWLFVLLHQFAAIDSLLEWRLSRDAIHAIKSPGSSLTSG